MERQKEKCNRSYLLKKMDVLEKSNYERNLKAKLLYPNENNLLLT